MKSKIAHFAAAIVLGLTIGIVAAAEQHPAANAESVASAAPVSSWDVVVTASYADKNFHTVMDRPVMHVVVKEGECIKGKTHVEKLRFIKKPVTVTQEVCIRLANGTTSISGWAFTPDQVAVLDTSQRVALNYGMPIYAKMDGSFAYWVSAPFTVIATRLSSDTAAPEARGNGDHLSCAITFPGEDSVVAKDMADSPGVLAAESKKWSMGADGARVEVFSRVHVGDQVPATFFLTEFETTRYLSKDGSDVSIPKPVTFRRYVLVTPGQKVMVPTAGDKAITMMCAKEPDLVLPPIPAATSKAD